MTRLFNKPEVRTYRSRLRNNQTDAELKLWSKLRKRQFFGYRFIRQFSIANYIVDFYSPKLRLAIEVDGGQHNASLNKVHDEKRTNYLRSLGIRVVRFWDNEVFANVEGVMEKLTTIFNPS